MTNGKYQAAAFHYFKKRNRNNTSSRDTAERHKSIYVESNEYSELCKYCNLSVQQSIAAIKYCLYRQFSGKGTGN